MNLIPSGELRPGKKGATSYHDATRRLGLRLHVLKVPLFGNALFLMVNAGVVAVSGAAFWLLVAMFYADGDVGYAAALVSVSGFLGGLAGLGLGDGLIRFLPGIVGSPVTARRVVNTSLTIVGSLGALLAIIFVAGIEFWTPSLSFLRGSAPLFATFVIATAIYATLPILNSIFVGLRRANYVIIGNLLSGVRALFPFLFSGALGVLSILLSFGLGGALAVMASLLFLLPRLIHHYRPAPMLAMEPLRPLVAFSLGNQIAGIVSGLLSPLLALLIVEMRSGAENAWFYVTWFLGSMLFLIPGSMTTSLFVEGSQPGANLNRDVRRTFVGAATLMLPAGLLFWVYGGSLLGVFGAGYSTSGRELLRWLVLSSPLVLANSVYLTLVRVRKQIVRLVVIETFATFFVLLTSFVLLPSRGIEAIGIAFVSAHGLIAAGIGISVVVQRVRTKRSAET